MVAHPRVSSSKSFFGAYAGLSVCTNYPEHISNQKRESATRSRRKLTLLSRAEMACLHSSAVPSIHWVIRPMRLIFGVFASMTGAGASEKRVTDEQQQRLDCCDLPSDGSRVAPIRGAGRTISGGTRPAARFAPPRAHHQRLDLLASSTGRLPGASARLYLLLRDIGRLYHVKGFKVDAQPLV